MIMDHPFPQVVAKPGGWKEDNNMIPPLQESRISNAAVVVSDITNTPMVVVLGGYVGYATTSSTEVLRHITSTSSTSMKKSQWKMLKSPLNEARAGCAAVVVGNVVYAMGGYGSSSMERLDMQRMDALDHKWESVQEDMDEVRGGAAAVVADANTILVLGGSNEAQPLGTVEIFQLATQKWIREQELIPPMPTPRAYHVAVKMNNSVYIVGGEDDQGHVVSSVDVLDLTTFEWTTLSGSVDMPSPAKYCAAAAVDEKHFVVAGGRDEENVFSTVRVFDAAQQQWTKLPSMRYARSAGSLVRMRSSLLAVGGKGADDCVVPVIETLDIETEM